MAPPISRPRADCRQRGPAQCGQRPGFADRTRRVDLPAAAHGENLPSLCLAAPLRRLIPGRPEADQDPVPEHHSLRHASADSRLSPTPVPGQDLIPVLAGRRRAAGRAPVHVGVKKVAEGRQVGCLQGQSDLLRDAFRSFQLPGHRPPAMSPKIQDPALAATATSALPVRDAAFRPVSPSTVPQPEETRSRQDDAHPGHRRRRDRAPIRRFPPGPRR